jgi:glucokinase
MLDLVADIGGTYARFALSENVPGKRPVLNSIVSLTEARRSSLVDTVEDYLETLPSGYRPRRAAIAIAAPVTGDHVALTNHPLAFSITQTAKRLGFDQFEVMNDYTATALSLPYLCAQDIAPIGPFEFDTAASANRTLGIIAPGTGLGVGGLVNSAGKGAPITSEGGHVSFAPADDAEFEIARRLARRFGHVSNERILSGPGLRNLYEAICVIHDSTPQAITAKQISERAVAGQDTFCRKALESFCAILGAAAGDLALTLQADAIFIGGGIVPNFVDFVRASAFRHRFESKGRFSGALEKTPTWAILYPHTGLLGAAVYLARAS